MLNVIRRINFPDDLNISGPIIKANMLRHVRTHRDLLQRARSKAKAILAKAQQDAEWIKENVKEETARSLHRDLEAIHLLATKKIQLIQKSAGSLCVDICRTIVQQLIDDLSAQEKIQMLVESLIQNAQHTRELHIQCHPDQVDLVQSRVASIIASQFNLKRWKVSGDTELRMFHIRLATPNDSEILVSLDNLIALYQCEIDALGAELNNANFFGIPDVEHL